MTDSELLITSTEILKEMENSLSNEMESIRHTMRRIGEELFYREHPECRIELPNDERTASQQSMPKEQKD